MAAEVLDEACSQGRPNPKAMKAMGRASTSAKATSQCSSRAEAEIAELYTSLCGYALRFDLGIAEKGSSQLPSTVLGFQI